MEATEDALPSCLPTALGVPHLGLCLTPPVSCSRAASSLPGTPLTQAQSLIRKVQLEKIPSGNPWTWGPQNVFVLCSLSSPKPGRSRVGSGFSCQAPMALVEPMKPKEQEKTPKDRPEGHSKNRSCIQLRNSPNLTRWGGRGADWASPQHEPMALFLASLPVLDLSAGVGA